MNSMTEQKAVIGVWPGLHYRDGQAALKFLIEGLGFSLIGLVIGAGAVVVRGLKDEDYGSRGFTVKDHEGNLWSVGTYRGEVAQ